MKPKMILVLALTIASASARDFDLNFENATLQNNSNGSTNVREDGLLWSPAYENLSSSGFSLPNGGARHGNRSLRIFTPSSTQSGFFRSELWLRNHTRSGLPHYSNRQAITEGTNKHFGFSIKVNGNTGSVRKWCNLSQIQQWGGMPAGSVHLKNGSNGKVKLEFIWRWGFSSTGQRRQDQRSFEIDKNKWYDIVIHFRESNSNDAQQRKWGDGTFAFWLYDASNGNRIGHHRHNGQFGYYKLPPNIPPGMTTRVGIYRCKDNPVVDASYDNVRMGRWWSQATPAR